MRTTNSCRVPGGVQSKAHAQHVPPLVATCGGAGPVKNFPAGSKDQEFLHPYLPHVFSSPVITVIAPFARLHSADRVKGLSCVVRLLKPWEIEREVRGIGWHYYRQDCKGRHGAVQLFLEPQIG